MNTSLDADRQAVVEEVRRFVDREVIPVAHDLEKNDIYPLELIDKLRALGVFGATIPESYGGSGFDLLTYVQIIEQLSRGWMSLAGIVNTHILVAYMIATYGTEDQRQRYLPVMAEGEKRGGICISEANAGSDVQAITMTAPTAACSSRWPRWRSPPTAAWTCTWMRCRVSRMPRCSPRRRGR